MSAIYTCIVCDCTPEEAFNKGDYMTARVMGNTLVSYCKDACKAAARQIVLDELLKRLGKYE